MGTRNLTVVVVDGETKVAQYGQWDGYPSGAGVKILASLKRALEEDFEDFREKVRSTSFISHEEIQRRWQEMGADDSGFVTMDVSKAMAEKYPQLQRDMGYNIIAHLIDSAPGQELDNNISFAADSLFCEYAYVVDLDANTLEVYRGFNKEPLGSEERFASLFSTEGQEHRDPDDLYHPVRLWRTFELSNLPDEEAFLDALNENDEDDDIDETPSVSSVKI
jgi:hypothetical protein